MFEDMHIPNLYALSAANPTESSWGSYCGSEAMVNGKSIGSCLGDLSSVSWMEDAEAVDSIAETLDSDFQLIKTKTSRSAVMQWGDVTFAADEVSEFTVDLNVVSGAHTRKPSSLSSQCPTGGFGALVHLVPISNHERRALAGGSRVAAGVGVIMTPTVIVC